MEDTTTPHLKVCGNTNANFEHFPISHLHAKPIMDSHHQQSIEFIDDHNVVIGVSIPPVGSLLPIGIGIIVEAPLALACASRALNDNRFNFMISRRGSQ